MYHLNTNGNFDKIFGNINIIFCGDLYQLPPVLATQIFKRCKNSFNNEIIWQYLEYFSLTQVMRQSDLNFSNILENLGEILNETEKK